MGQRFQNLLTALAIFGRHIYPDLVVEDRETGIPLLVADTKYKVGEKVSPEDVNQVLAYSMKLNCTEAILIYPFVTADPYKHDWSGTNVACSCFDLSKSIEEGGELLLDEILGKCTVAWERMAQEGSVLL